MSHALTEVDTYSGTVVVPDAGDARTAASVETPFQSVTNRTLNLKNRLDSSKGIAKYSLSGTGIASGAKATLTELVDVGPFNMASNDVEVPAAGTYLVAISGNVTGTATTNPLTITVTCQNASGTAADSIAVRFSATPADLVPFAAVGVIQITTPSTEKLHVDVFVGSGTVSISGTLTIHRLLVI